MKKLLLPLFVASTIFISSTSISKQSKPEVPVSVLIKGFPYTIDENELQNYISSCTKEGYVVKSINGASGSGGSWWYLIMGLQVKFLIILEISTSYYLIIIF